MNGRNAWMDKLIGKKGLMNKDEDVGERDGWMKKWVDNGGMDG